MSFLRFKVSRHPSFATAVRQSCIEPLEGRRLLSAAGLLASPAAPGAGAGLVMSQSHTHHHRRPHNSGYVGSFVGSALDFNAGNNQFQADKHFSITITSYTPPPVGGRGSIIGTIATRHGAVSFSGFVSGNAQGGFAYARGTDPSDPDINHGPSLVFTATLGADGRLTGAVSGTIGGAQVSESFVSLKHA